MLANPGLDGNRKVYNCSAEGGKATNKFNYNIARVHLELVTKVFE